MTFEDFRARAARGCLVPVWRESVLDTETPVAAFAKLKRGPFSFLLESAPAGGETWSRYTFMGTEPRAAWRMTDGRVEDWTPERGWHGGRAPADPLDDLDRLVKRYAPVDVPELGAFWAGAVGYFGYDVVRCIERLPHAPPRTLDAPDALFVFTNVLVVVDNLRSRARFVAGVPVPADAGEADLRALYERAQADIADAMRRVHAPGSLPPLALDESAPPAVGASRYPRDRFLRDVDRIRDYIVAGDAFQVLLARRITLPHDFSSDLLYRALRVVNPSPYMYHLELDGVELVGSSPELLVRVSEGRVTVRPIAGTRPRGRSAAEDDALAAELLADEKERAEHLMLVDLARNDIGRVCSFGTVTVPEFMTVERYSHVMHIVSQVEGRIAPGKNAFDLMRATFPAGTVSGAPKIRAMQIIAEQEKLQRGFYAGALGYFSYDGNLDSCITLRTALVKDGKVFIQAGGGVVADSVPALEYQESVNKASALLKAVAIAEQL